jgi:predicted Zn-dependent protease
MSITLKGKAFDGQTSTQHEAVLQMGEDGIISCSPELHARIHIAEVNISSRVGSIPRTLTFPSGMVFETKAHDMLDSYIKEHHKRIDLAHLLESKTGFALGAFLFVFIFVLGSLFWGIPWASNTLADVLPAKASTYIGQGTLESMDKVFFFESLLSDEHQHDLQEKFRGLLPEDQEELQYSLVFRQGGLIGANAFALPDGTILMTDELVELAHHDDEILSILLHEIGHIEHRHSLRQIISHSGLALLTVMFTGDAVSAGSIMLTLPNVLMQSSFSREHESEADEYSLSKMRVLGIQTDHFANIMQRLEQEYIEEEEGEEDLDFDNKWLEYFSTHPSTDDRIARFRTENTQQNTNEFPVPELLSNYEKNQGSDVFSLRGLLEQGNYERLTTVLNSYQLNYEQGMGSEITAELAYEYLAFSDPQYEALLNEWIESMPTDYAAYLARATYYHNLAETIDNSYQNEEPSDGIAMEVKENQDKAVVDAKKALQLKSNLGLAYSVLISIAASQDKENLRQTYIDEALQTDPSSYVIRRDALYYLSPELGGSYAKISRFLVDTKKHLDKNPDMERLLGYLYYVKSWDAYNNSKYKRTIRLATAALKDRHDSSYYQQRANSFYSTEAYEHALIDYTNAIKLDSYNPDLYLWRAYTYTKLSQTDLALKDLIYAARLFPYHRDILVKLGNISYDQEQFTQAGEAYKSALVYNPDNPYLWYGIGRNLLFGEGKVDEALPFLKKATDMNPEVGNYWYAYGAALHDYGDCKAVAVLEKYLEICDKDKDYDCYEDTRKWAEDAISKMEQKHCAL